MGFGIKSYGKNFEVGITNMHGQFRLEDFWSPPGGASYAECKEFIRRIEAAKKEIGNDILSKRASAKND